MDNVDLGRLMLVAGLTDPQGNPVEPNTVICLTGKDEYARGSPIKAVVVSSQLHHTTADCMVVLNGLWAKGGHPQTGFTKKCAAICCWVVEVAEDDILRCRNLIYGRVFEEVRACVTRVQAEKKKARSTHS